MDEFLRYTLAVRGPARMTTRDVEVGGLVTPEGSPVALMFSSGSRDVKVFEDACAHAAIGSITARAFDRVPHRVIRSTNRLVERSVA
ncbi:hypothetical protein [Nocardia vaccinii]|uniref:hypothetical protein n=1 Tax=Nocardia vaccinii TaxID=1822 RepID=UPI0035A257AF